MFLFACYTGLRFSDITMISKDNLITQEGNLWLSLTMQKTTQNIKGYDNLKQNKGVYIHLKGDKLTLRFSLHKFYNYYGRWKNGKQPKNGRCLKIVLK